MAFTRKRYYNLIKNPNTELLKNKKQLIKRSKIIFIKTAIEKQI